MRKEAIAIVVVGILAALGCGCIGEAPTPTQSTGVQLFEAKIDPFCDIQAYDSSKVGGVGGGIIVVWTCKENTDDEIWYGAYHMIKEYIELYESGYVYNVLFVYVYDNSGEEIGDFCVFEQAIRPIGIMSSYEAHGWLMPGEHIYEVSDETLDEYSDTLLVSDMAEDAVEMVRGVYFENRNSS